MAAETLYTANTGIVTINTANANLDGTGTLGTLLTAASNGTKVRTVKIKAVGSTTAEGMVRFFVDEGGGAKLILEVRIPIVTQSGSDRGFERNIPLNLDLQSGAILKVSTQVADTFNIIAEGVNWAYNTSVRPDSTNYTSNIGIGVVTTANSNLDGTTGSVITVFTAGSSATYNGCSIRAITIKAIVSTTTDGMVRLFIQNAAGTVTKLFMEVPIPIVTATSTLNAFGRRIKFPRGFNLQAGYKILATTQNSNSFNVVVEGNDWNYPVGNVLGYTLYGQSASVAVNPADSTTYYFGSTFLGTLNTAADRCRIYIPATGTIDACYLLITVAGTLGTSETSTIYIRKSGVDTTVSSSVQANQAVNAVSNSALNIAVTAGNYIELKWVTPAWVTNPTSVGISAQIHIKTNL
ncbi:MAG: hypothetical protein WAQ28_08945 [Bacteroidia bacterium]